MSLMTRAAAQIQRGVEIYEHQVDRNVAAGLIRK